jgi:hypothetical protein
MLILKHHGLPLHEVAEGGWFELSNGAICAPAYAGWADENGHSLEEAPATAPYVPTLAERRAAAVLPKLDFCLALMRLAILPAEECKAAARGEWPATFAGFVAGMSAEDATEAEIRWAAATQIFYANPLLQALAQFKAGGDPVQAAALLDAIFGIGE